MGAGTHPIWKVLFWTDDRNAPGSRRLAIVTRDADDVRKLLEKAIRRGDVTYGSGRRTEKQLWEFRMDWNSGENRKSMNRKLKGAFIDTVLNGREYLPPEKRERKKG